MKINPLMVLEKFLHKHHNKRKKIRLCKLIGDGKAIMMKLLLSIIEKLEIPH
jgi:hypothetical protein